MPPLAHRLTRPIEISAAGHKWRIVFTHRVLLDIEGLTGMDAMRINLSKLSARLLRAVLFSALREAGCGMDLEDAGAMLRPGKVDGLRRSLIEAWIASFPERQPEQDQPSEQAHPLSTVEAWAKARYDFRLSDEDWLSMTPRMLHAVALRQLEGMRHLELMNGILCAHTVNSSYRAPRSPSHPGVYMLHPYPEEPDVPVFGEALMSVFADMPKQRVN